MPTRRRFILNCSALALAVAAVPPLALGSPRRMQEVSLDRISLAAFRVCLNKSFQVSDSGVSAELILVKVEEPVFKHAQSHAKDAGNEKFILVFQGPLAAPLEQNTYSFESEWTGRFAMFITQVVRNDQEHAYYAAVFNRPAASSLK